MRLRVRQDGSFKIVQLTDLHIGSKPYHGDDHKTFNLIEKAFTQLDADLIIISGDLIWSEGVPQADVVFQELVDRINQYPVPVAVTYGNHDSEDEFVRNDIRKLAEGLKYHVPKHHSFIVEDREAYTIEVFQADGHGIEHVIYILDSGAYGSIDGVGTYAWNHPEQITWYNRVSHYYQRPMTYRKDLLFQHIPLPEYWQAAENIIAGECNETNDMISAPYVNTGLFASVLINGQVGGVFCGHDHDNNFVGLHHDIQLIYGQITGYQCYGDFQRGARIVELKPDGMETYTIVDSEI